MHALIVALRATYLADGSSGVPLSTLLYPLIGLLGGALITVVGNVVVARIQARASAPAAGLPVLVTVDKAWLDELIDSERVLSGIVALHLPHIDPATGKNRTT